MEPPKMAVSFANIFMAKIETTLIQQSETKQKEWRRYIDDNYLLPNIKFTAEISENEITFLDIQ